MNDGTSQKIFRIKAIKYAIAVKFDDGTEKSSLLNIEIWKKSSALLGMGFLIGDGKALLPGTDWRDFI